MKIIRQMSSESLFLLRQFVLLSDEERRSPIIQGIARQNQPNTQYKENMQHSGKVSLGIGLAIVLSMLWLGSCQPTAGDQQLTAAQQDSLRQRIDYLADTVEVRWKRMLANEDEKLRTLGLWLEAAVENPKADARTLDSAAMLLSAINDTRFDRTGITDSTIMDPYDARTELLISKLREHRDLTPDFDGYKRSSMLFIEVLNREAAELALRRAYSEAVSVYNLTLSQHQAQLSQLGPEYEQMQPAPDFFYSRFHEVADQIAL